MRVYFVLIHRYVGLVLAGFLLVAGLTGSLLAWNEALDAALSPQLFKVEQSGPALDQLVLRERVAALYPQARFRYVPLHTEPGKSVVFYLQALPGQPELPNDEVYLDPATGAVLGERKWGDLGQGLKNLMPFIYRLHFSLALGVIGDTLFGIVALLWTLDCFIGAYLTFPVAAPRAQKPWLQRWKPAWRVRWGSGSYKVNFDLHRAGGLWVWAMLLVVAWSSVAFNLTAVYRPVMGVFFSSNEQQVKLPKLAVSQPEPGMGWAEARSLARRHMAAEAQRLGFTVDSEQGLSYDPATALYRYNVHSSADIRTLRGSTMVFIDANTGALRSTYLPSGQYAGDTITNWLTSLHMAQLWGWPMQMFVCSVGLLVAVLCVTGVVVWLRKRRAGRMAKGVASTQC